jgi:hypothetical protein
MNRHSFVWPVAADKIQQVVNAIPNCTYWDPVANGAPSFQPELRYVRPSDNALLRCYVIKRISGIAIPHLGASAGTGQKWDVFQMTPRHIEHREGDLKGRHTAPKSLGTRVMHKLARFIANHDDLNTDPQGRKWTGLPMSFAEVLERYPVAANAYLKPQQPKAGGAEGETEPVPGANVMLNPVPGGLDPEAAASIDYRPTAQQAQDDNDISEDLWPAPPAE